MFSNNTNLSLEGQVRTPEMRKQYPWHFPKAITIPTFFVHFLSIISAESTQSCQSPTPPSCSHMPYNMTASTNSTEEIEAQMAVYMPLIQTGCSSSLISFFCSIHAPPCDDMGRQLIPCREMCEEAIGGCPILEQVSPGISSQCLLYPARSSGNCFYFVGEAETAPGEIIYVNKLFI